MLKTFKTTLRVFRSGCRSRSAMTAVGLSGALCLAVSPSAASAAAVNRSAAPEMKQVAYHGYHFQVPATWPVINLAAHPHTCVLFDRSAIYLGAPGPDENCPAGGVGRPAGAILVQPAPASTAASSAEDPTARQVTVTGPRIRVTASYGGNRAAVQQILASASLPAPAVRAPSAASAAAQSSPAASDVSTNGSGKGFDACAAPSSATMSAWNADSPYSVAGVYIGGSDRACAQANLTSGWVSQQASAGWTFIPLYVGPQAEFGQITSPASQGESAADDAVS